MSNKKPVHDLKVGRVRGAIWENTGDTGTWHSITFSRLYKDEAGSWKDSTSFSRDDLPLLMKVADQAFSILLEQPGSESQGE